MRNAEESVVLEREILHDERASHIGIVRLLDQNGEPVEGEAVTFYSEGSGEEVLESTRTAKSTTRSRRRRRMRSSAR